MKKTVDIQPWVDYFRMLMEYEEKGYLELRADKHEAFVTRAALHAMSDGDDPMEQLKKAVPDSAMRIRTYAGWKSQAGIGYMEKPFAVHVVKEEYPHDLLYTLLITRQRTWRSLWRDKERIEVIGYDDGRE